MNGLDVILGLPLLYALYTGFKEGVIVQLGGIAGLVLGVWFAFRYGTALGSWLGIDPEYATAAGFLLIVLGVLLVIALFSRLLRGMFHIAGLGTLDRIGGVVLSVAKTALILSILLSGFDALNRQAGWVKQESIDRSILYRPIDDVSDLVFPYLVDLKDRVYDANN